MTLTAILPTHHHYDHVGGNEDLLKAVPGPHRLRRSTSASPASRSRYSDGDHLTLASLAIAQVMFIPAHTTGHIAYYFPDERAVFTGDTLFAGGCGRLFEGDAAMMIGSLSKLSVPARRHARLFRPRVHREEPALRADARAATTPPCARNTPGRRRR